MGFNSRLDAVQAVVLAAKLRRLDRWNARRREIAARYAELLDGLDGLDLPTAPDDGEHAWHLYVVRLDERERVRAELAADGVETAVHYPTALHRSPAFEGVGTRSLPCPVADEAAGRILSLPMFPHMADEQVEHVARSLRAALRRPERGRSWPAA
jgi:dTDP-4-amino-4,6-dideoxygalactose transaminase